MFTPEFLNRVDEQILFNALDKGHIGKIIDIELADLYKRIEQAGFTIKISKKAKDFVANKGFDPQYGAGRSNVPFSVIWKIRSLRPYTSGNARVHFMWTLIRKVQIPLSISGIIRILKDYLKNMEDRIQKINIEDEMKSAYID